MTDAGHCPDLVVLSSFLDGELAGGENENVKVHLGNCPGCAGRLKDLEMAGRSIINHLERATGLSDRSPSADCPSGDVLSSYLHDLLPADEKHATEVHLDHCDACLSDLASMARTDAQLRRTPAEPVPRSLREKVEAIWSKAEKATEPILKVVCRLAQDGIEFLRDSLLPQGVTYQLGYAASGAYRGVAEPSLPSSILFKGNVAGIQLGLSVEWEGADRAGLKVKIEDEEFHPLSAQRIHLRREQILVYSERTDANGNVTIPNLEPGTYEIGISALGKECTIDFELRKN